MTSNVTLLDNISPQGMCTAQDVADMLIAQNQLKTIFEKQDAID